MDINEITALKKKVIEDYEKNLREIERGMQAKLDAIDIVSRLLKGSSVNVENDVQADQAQCNAAKDEHELQVESKIVAGQEIMVKIMDDCPSPFTKNDAQKLCQEKYPNFSFSRNSWHNATKKKIASGEIHEIQAGAGRSPAVYSKTDKYKAQGENKGMLAEETKIDELM